MIKEIDITDWGKYTPKHSTESPLFSKEWLCVLSEEYNLDIKILGYFINDDLQVAIPFTIKKSLSGRKKLICLPFTDYLHFVPALPMNLLNELNGQIGTDYISAEIRTSFLPVNDNNPGMYYHYLDISEGYLKAKKLFNKQTLRNIQKSMKFDLKLIKSEDMESLRGFYRLNVITRKRHGLPPQPFSFFEKIYKYILANKMGFTATVYLQENAIASALFLINGETIVFKYGASDKKYFYTRANYFLFNEIISYACESGYKILDFGICPQYNTGLRQFKSGWGVIEKGISYTIVKGNSIKAVNKKRPANITKFIFRSLPPRINVFLSKFLYKYAV